VATKISSWAIANVAISQHCERKALLGQTFPQPQNTSLSPNTLADLSQFFSILSDLKCYGSAFSSSTNHHSNANPKEHPKMSSQENNFVQITKSIFFIVCAYHLDIVTYVSFKFLAGLATNGHLLRRVMPKEPGFPKISTLGQCAYFEKPSPKDTYLFQEHLTP